MLNNPMYMISNVLGLSIITFNKISIGDGTYYYFLSINNINLFLSSFYLNYLNILLISKY